MGWMSRQLRQFCPTENLIDSITGSDQFPHDFKVCWKSCWDNNLCLFRQFCPTENLIDSITGSDQFPHDFKVCAKSCWDNYHCLRRKWEHFGFCHWLFRSHRHQYQLPISHLLQKQIAEEIKSILIDVEGRGHFLVQFWNAIDIEQVEGQGTTQKILTIRNQTCGLNSTDTGLYAYGGVSRFCEFHMIGEQEYSGLPNRVFRNLRPESLDCNNKAFLAFPLYLFNRWVGVIEIVTSSDCPTNEIFRYIVSKYAKDPCFGKCIHLNEQNDKKEKALEEIKKSLEEVRRIHDIRLAQTWIPCKICDALLSGPAVFDSQDKQRSFLFIRRTRCLKGTGVAGKAFLSKNLEFCEDVSRFCTTDYHFKLSGLTACFAVCLRSNCLNEEDDIYVVEFFLPPNYMEFGDWRTTAISLLSTMRQHLTSVSIASRGEIGKNLPIDDDNLVENGGETVRLNSTNREKEKDAIAHVENNNDSNTEETNMIVTSSQQKVQHRKAGIPISLELLQQHFGMKLEDAAESIGVSRSTLKRACREYKITWWPSRKRKNKENHYIPKKSLQCATAEKQIDETSEAPISDLSASRSTLKRACREYKITRWPSRNKKNKENHNISKKSLQCAATEKRIDETSKAPISDPSGKQDTETNACTELHDQDTSSVTIKAKFGADFIKFKIPITSGMAEFQHQVEKRLHLKGGTYSVRYQDDDNDSILVICDEDLQDYVCYSRAMGRNTVAVSLHPITNFPNYPF